MVSEVKAALMTAEMPWCHVLIRVLGKGGKDLSEGSKSVVRSHWMASVPEVPRVRHRSIEIIRVGDDFAKHPVFLFDYGEPGEEKLPEGFVVGKYGILDYPDNLYELDGEIRNRLRVAVRYYPVDQLEGVLRERAAKEVKWQCAFCDEEATSHWDRRNPATRVRMPAVPVCEQHADQTAPRWTKR